MSERLRVGVVGLGIGFQHLTAWKALEDRFQVTGVCDADGARTALARRLFGIPFGCERFEELLARDDLDIVDLCTPPSLHFEMARAALQSGRHVVCEKPLAASLAEVDELTRCERESGRLLMPIFQYRFGRGVQRLRRLVESGVAGRAYLATVETAWMRSSAYYAVPWRGRFDTELGGVCVSHAIHAHDLLLHVLGPAKEVYARLATRVNAIESEDCAVATLEMADGSLAALSATLGSAREISRLRFCFEHLTAESSLSPYVPGAEPWTFVPGSREAAERIDHEFASFDPGIEGFAAQFAAFHDAIRSGSAPPVTLADARCALELVTALYHSAETGLPVSLPLASDHPKRAGWRPATGVIRGARVSPP